MQLRSPTYSGKCQALTVLLKASLFAQHRLKTATARRRPTSTTPLQPLDACPWAGARPTSATDLLLSGPLDGSTTQGPLHCLFSPRCFQESEPIIALLIHDPDVTSCECHRGPKPEPCPEEGFETSTRWPSLRARNNGGGSEAAAAADNPDAEGCRPAAKGVPLVPAEPHSARGALASCTDAQGRAASQNKRMHG